MPYAKDRDTFLSQVLQTFGAKFVLEVLGGCGAIWGFSEVLTIRNTNTQHTWRVNACTIGFIFFIRYLLQIRDFIDHANVKNTGTKRLVQIFAAKLVLEVFGGGGAIWGFSEVLTLRNPNTQEEWRKIAATVGAIFFLRWCLQIADFISGNDPDHKGSNKAVRLFQIFSAKLVLEVFGGGGAIWGASEALTLRVPDTQEYFRGFAQAVAIVFFGRWLIQMKNHVRENFGADEDRIRFLRTYQIFSAKFILEVCGGAGAIWGFSEVLTLRNAETVHTWRHIALTIGSIFLIRWFMQMQDFIGSVEHANSGTARLIFVFSAKLVLEVFGGGGAIWGFSEVVTFRNDETRHPWQVTATVVGALFFVRWCLQIKDFITGTNPDEGANKKVRLVQIFLAKIVLEVFGGGGAIWGSTEALTLRVPATQEFWRFWASVGGFVFFMRYLLQIRDYVNENMNDSYKPVSTSKGGVEDEGTPLIV